MKYKSLNIGREGSQSQSLTDPSISRKHATLTFLGGDTSRYTLELDNKLNCLWANGISVISCECKVTDEVCLGLNKVKLDMVMAINDLRVINGLPKLSFCRPEEKKQPVDGRNLSKVIIPPSKGTSNRKEESDFSEIIPAQKPAPKRIQQEAKKQEEEKKQPDPGKEVRKEQIITLSKLYSEYEAFIRKENLQGFIVKMANCFPVLALLIVRMATDGKVSFTILISGFILLQAAAVILLQEHTRRTRKRSARFMSQFRNDYHCPLNPDKPLFYASGGLPIPFDDLENGINCTACGAKCKKLKK